MDWFKQEADFPDHHKTIAVAEELFGGDVVRAVGRP